MPRLTAAMRRTIPHSEFGIASKAPGPGSYPMEDASHAENAKGRAAQAVKAGRMSASTEKRLDAKADRVLGKSNTSKPKQQQPYRKLLGM